MKNALAVVVGLGATAVAKKAVDATWRIGAKKSPPTDPTDPDTSLKEAVLFAVLSGAAVSVARMLISRRAAKGERDDRALLAAAKSAQR